MTRCVKLSNLMFAYLSSHQIFKLTRDIRTQLSPLYSFPWGFCICECPGILNLEWTLYWHQVDNSTLGAWMQSDPHQSRNQEAAPNTAIRCPRQTLLIMRDIYLNSLNSPNPTYPRSLPTFDTGWWDKKCSIPLITSSKWKDWRGVITICSYWCFK